MSDIADRVPETVIDVHGLTKSFGGVEVVRGVDMAVERGQIYGFLGPNGSGKTTTIRMLCGLLTPDAGTGTCLGYDILTDSERIRRHVGYMTQRFSLYEDLSIRENLEFVARVFGLAHPRRTAKETLDQLGLTPRADLLAGALSGGWKQRLALAACTMHGPDLLLLDEPTAGVDPKARREFWDQIHRLADEGLTVLVSTHYMDEAERCHEIAYLSAGRILTRGTVQQVIDQAALSTWVVAGRGTPRLASSLRRDRRVEMVAAFGNELHVSGTDADALEEAIAPYRDDERFTWRRGAPSLEDVFIHLMGTPEGTDDRYRNGADA